MRNLFDTAKRIERTNKDLTYLKEELPILMNKDSMFIGFKLENNEVVLKIKDHTDDIIDRRYEIDFTLDGAKGLRDFLNKYMKED